MTSLPSQFGHFKIINYNTQNDKWKMSELLGMFVQEEERLRVEKLDMAHLTIASPSKKKKFFKKCMSKKKKQVIMHLTMGKMTKIRYNVLFATRKVTKKRNCSGFKAWLEKKGRAKGRK